MDESQKRCFRALLVALQELLEARTRSSAAEIAIGSARADPADRASAEEQHELALAARVRDAAQLVDLRAALKRIEADEFGWCTEAGDMILVGRLLIYRPRRSGSRHSSAMRARRVATGADDVQVQPQSGLRRQSALRTGGAARHASPHPGRKTIVSFLID
jgi:RNA polymerase-binding protein DksA